MDQVWVHRCWVAIACGFGWLGLIVSPPAFAQITPDNTLGNESSRVNRNVQVRGGNADRIDGGAARGRNLFHSFREFNVNEGQRVYFANPSGVENILGRVTGTDVSDIMGTLGVDGGANLFMLNPNGIIFGPNARLDISGSFTASTADSFTFLDGSLFSATSPGDASLLSVAVPLGVQYGANPPSAILNAGNLLVGHDFKLSGGSVTSTGLLSAPNGALVVEGVAGDVQVRQASAQTATLSASNNLVLQDSQLQTLGDLNLLAGNTVQARDSVANPFIAYAGGNLTVQGNQNVDIFALNHPSSGLVSGRDMVLRSTNTVGGDAHYWAGGNFRIEQLDGDLGNLFSPYDPIILTNGDVALGDYTGASLHILAGGSVTLGNVTITGVGDEATTINPNNTTLFNGSRTYADLANFNLTKYRATFNRDGTVRSVDPVAVPITINGSTQATLDVRAGVDWAALGGLPTNQVLPGTPGPTTPQPFTPTITGTASRADITIDGSIQNPGGTVFLTNQYQPDSNLPQDGIIRVGNIDTSVETGNAGSVFLNAAGDITLETTSRSSANVNSNVQLENMAINSQTNGGGNGGDVTLISTNGRITLPTTGQPDGNDITPRGGIYTQIRNNGDDGNGGSITLNARGNIFAGQLDSSANSGNGSLIELISIGGDIDTTGGTLFSGSDTGAPSGRASGIFLSALNNTTIGGIDTASGGNGGDITINTGSFFLNSGRRINTSVSGSPKNTPPNRGNAGNITINARDLVQILGTPPLNSTDGSVIFSNIPEGAIGKAGDINISARVFQMTDAAQIQNFNNGQGNAGNVTINASDSVSLDGSRGFNRDNVRFNLPTSLFAEASNGSDGGNISITTGELFVTNGAQIKNTASGAGRAGDITIHARDSATITGRGANGASQINSFGDTNGGNIYITTGELTLANADQDGGNLTVSTKDGTAGSIAIEADNVLLRDNGQITASAESGEGGTIILRGGRTPSGQDINMQSLQVINSEIAAQATKDNGQAGSLTISANEVQLRGTSNEFPSIRNETERGGLFVRVTGAGGRAGDLTVNARQVTVEDGASISASNVSSQTSSSVSSQTSDIGNIALQGLDTLNINSSGQITASTETGQAGNVTINANTVNVNGVSGRVAETNSRIAVEATKEGGFAGNVTVNARQVTVSNNASISASNLSSPNSGDPGDIVLQGLNILDVNSGGQIIASTETGRAGSVTINANNSNANNSVKISGINSRIAAEATGAGGRAGNVTVNARQVTVSDDAGISTSNVSSQTSDTGNIVLNDLNTLDVNSGGRIIASTETGRAGSITINANNSNANNSVKISGINSRIAAEATGAGGRAGDVTIDARQVTVSNDASISTSSISPPKGEGSSFGNIDLRGLDELIVEAGGEITASTETGQAGDITIDANDAVRVRNDGRIVVEANRNGGTPGNIKISTNELVVNNGEISASGTSGGSRGNIRISASDAVRVENNGRIAVEANRNGGVAGGIRIRTDHLRLDNGEISVAATGRNGQAGTIRINARDAVLRNNSQITAATGPLGQGGEIVLRGRRRSHMRSLRVFNSEIAARTGSGRAGDLTIRANNVRIDGDNVPSGNNSSLSERLRARGGLSVEATESGGQAGDLTVNARQVTVEDGARVSASSNDNESNESSEKSSEGNVRLRGLDTLVVNNGGEINASTRTGRAGSVRIDANDSVAVTGEDSRLAVEATGDGGRAGSLTINTNQFLLQDGAVATVESPKGQAGDLTITASSATLDNSTLRANAGNANGENNANITLNTSGTLLQLQDAPQDESSIFANATGGADGGNITLDADGFVLVNVNDDSDITANATDGKEKPSGDGGQVIINTNAIFGLERRDLQTILSDITATSQSGNTGTIVLNTLNIDPTRGLGELPIETVDTANLVAEGCVGKNRSGVTHQGEFTHTGRGGLSPNPTDPLSSETILDQLATLYPETTPSGSASIPPAEPTTSLIEAQGLSRDANGKVSLVSTNNSSNSSNSTGASISTPNICDAP